MDYDENKYKVVKLPNVLLLHWIINPGLAFNELILGQRLPKVTLLDKQIDAPLMERQYVPCPHCNTIHHGLFWSKKSALGNWFGLLCPSCNKSIPCLWNLTSLALLVVTFPIWGCFKKPVKARWVHYKKQQYAKEGNTEQVTAKTTSWFKMGLFFGLAMFGFTMAMEFFGSAEVASKSILNKIIVCSVAGLAFGAAMKFVLGRENKKVE